MAPDGTDVTRLTNRVGPDGGPFFSWDGKQIAFRGRELSPGAELDDYRALLKQALWRPTSLELFVMDREGRGARQVTRLGGANFAPSWHPDGKRLIFASNSADAKGRNFDIYTVNASAAGTLVSIAGELTGQAMDLQMAVFSPTGANLFNSSTGTVT